MKLHRAAILATGVAGAVAAAIWLTGETGDPAARDAAGPRGRASPASDPIRTLEREVDALRARVDRPRVTATAADERPAGGAASPGESPPRPARVYEPAEIAAMLDVYHASEPPDPRWTDDLRAALAGVGGGPGTTVTSVQCSRSLCKAAVVHDTAASQRDLASRLVGLPAIAGGVLFDYEDGADPPRTTLYIAREGHSFRDMIAAQ